MVTSTSCHRGFAYEITYQVPCTSGHRKILAFWYKQKPVPQKKSKALGARSEACSLTTTLGHRNPPPTPSHGKRLSNLMNVSGGCEGTVQPFFCVFLSRS
jgi:hypothetical protein